MKSLGRGKWRLLVVLVFLGLIWFALNAGKILVVNDPQPADVIVVLAGETDHRPARAIQLLDQGYAPSVVLDVPADMKFFEFSAMQMAERYAHDLPEAAAVSICPVVGLSTRDESHDVEKCLVHVTGSRVLLVTSDFHTRRALSIFRHQLPGKIFTVAAAQDDEQFGTRWWTHRQWAKTCYEEWLRTVWWNAVDRWR